MRSFKLLKDPVRDVEVFELGLERGGLPPIKFWIRRAGYPAYQKAVEAKQRTVMMEAMKAELERRDMSLSEAMQGLDFEELAQNMKLADVDIEALVDLDAGAVVELVERVEGLEDETGPIAWSKEVGIDLFEQFSFIAAFVVERATELEEEFQALLEVARGNLPEPSE